MNSKAPKYVEIYSELKQAIMRGDFPIGSFLPTENELVEQFNASKTTIRHAVRLLRDHNLVEVKQGSGTKVLPVEQKTVTGAKYNIPGSTTAITVRYNTEGEGKVDNTRAVIDSVPASETVACALHIEPGTMVYRLQRLQIVDGIIFGYMVNYLPEDTVPDLISKGEIITDLYGHLSRNYGIKVLEIEESVDVLAAGFMEAQYLQVDIGTPLLILRRNVTGNTGMVEYCETIVRPDIFRMTVRLNASGQSDIEPLI